MPLYATIYHSWYNPLLMLIFPLLIAIALFTLQWVTFKAGIQALKPRPRPLKKKISSMFHRWICVLLRSSSVTFLDMPDMPKLVPNTYEIMIWLKPLDLRVHHGISIWWSSKAMTTYYWATQTSHDVLRRLSSLRVLTWNDWHELKASWYCNH